MPSLSTRGGGDHRQHYGLTMVALAFSALAFSLSNTLVIPAIPEIQGEYGISTEVATFLITGFMLTASVATPILGRFGDMFGKERLLLATMSVFALGTLVAALADSIEMLLAGRLIQGFGGGVFPLCFGIIRDEFPRERVSTGIGMIGAVFGIGGSVGLVLSGVMVDNLGVASLFWFSLAAIAAAIVATHLFVPESPVKSPARIDWAGAGLLSAGLVALLIAISQGNSWGWGSPATIGLMLAGAAVLLGWIRFERGYPEPLVDMRMMRSPLVWIPNLVSFLIGFSLFGCFILISEFVQAAPETGYGFGASATEAGLFLFPSSVTMLFAGLLSGWLSGRLGSSKLPLVVGAAISAVGYASVALLHSEEWMIYMAFALIGLGNGFSFAALPNLILEAVDQTMSGVATGMNTIMRTIGGALGGQIVASIVAGHLSLETGFPEETGFTVAFLLESFAVVVAFGAALAIPTRLIPRRSPIPTRSGRGSSFHPRSASRASPRSPTSPPATRAIHAPPSEGPPAA